MKNGSSNLPDRIVPKGSAQSKTYRHHSKIPKLVLATGKHQMSAKKSTKSSKIIRILE